jgi:hypothetical protein
MAMAQAASSVVFALCSPDLESVADFTYINNCFPTKVPGAHLWQKKQKKVITKKSFFLETWI